MSAGFPGPLRWAGNSRLGQAIGEFVHFLSVEKAAADNTVAAYRNDVRQLADHVIGRLRRQNEVRWESVDRRMMQDFVLGLERGGYRQSSVARKVAAARSFFTFLVGEGIVSCDPTDGFSSPRVTRIPSRAISVS
jgi:integrase/recombinase XerD